MFRTEVGFPTSLLELHQKPAWDFLGGPLVKTLHFQLRSCTQLDSAKKRNIIFPYFQRSSYSLGLEILVRSLTPRLQRDWYSNPGVRQDHGGQGKRVRENHFHTYGCVFLSRHPREGKLVYNCVQVNTFFLSLVNVGGTTSVRFRSSAINSYIGK